MRFVARVPLPPRKVQLRKSLFLNVTFSVFLFYLSLSDKFPLCYLSTRKDVRETVETSATICRRKNGKRFLFICANDTSFSFFLSLSLSLFLSENDPSFMKYLREISLVLVRQNPHGASRVSRASPSTKLFPLSLPSLLINLHSINLTLREL